MVLIRAGAVALRMDQVNFDATNADVVGDSSQIQFIYSPQHYVTFNGSFTYDSFGRPSGTIASIENVEGGLRTFTLSGATYDVQTLFNQTSDAAVIYALNGDDRIYGKGFDDTLIGLGGDDRIIGGGGSDTIYGGLGADRLDGGIGADIFKYTSTADSTVAAAGRDRILNFDPNQGDKIDLTLIDAVAGGSDDAFTVVTDRFHRVAGELFLKEQANGFVVLGDTDGNGKADFSIFVDSATLTANDFNL